MRCLLFLYPLAPSGVVARLVEVTSHGNPFVMYEINNKKRKMYERKMFEDAFLELVQSSEYADAAKGHDDDLHELDMDDEADYYEFQAVDTPGSHGGDPVVGSFVQEAEATNTTGLRNEVSEDHSHNTVVWGLDTDVLDEGVVLYNSESPDAEIQERVAGVDPVLGSFVQEREATNTKSGIHELAKLVREEDLDRISGVAMCLSALALLHGSSASDTSASKVDEGLKESCESTKNDVTKVLNALASGSAGESAQDFSGGEEEEEEEGEGALDSSSFVYTLKLPPGVSIENFQDKRDVVFSGRNAPDFEHLLRHAGSSYEQVLGQPTGISPSSPGDALVVLYQAFSTDGFFREFGFSNDNESEDRSRTLKDGAKTEVPISSKERQFTVGAGLRFRAIMEPITQAKVIDLSSKLRDEWSAKYVHTSGGLEKLYQFERLVSTQASPSYFVRFFDTAREAEGIPEREALALMLVRYVKSSPGNKKQKGTERDFRVRAMFYLDKVSGSPEA
ncbi:unnamed protein product [Amoebophrya sp. A25]|nr:unnamed protein product [Amoebophrya sp. A25]|eukprot:GSA25T00024952001.1